MELNKAEQNKGRISGRDQIKNKRKGGTGNRREGMEKYGREKGEGWLKKSGEVVKCFDEGQVKQGKRRKRAEGRRREKKGEGGEEIRGGRSK